MNWILQLLPWGIRFLAPSPLPAPNGTRYPCFSMKKSFLNWKPSTWWPRVCHWARLALCVYLPTHSFHTLYPANQGNRCLRFCKMTLSLSTRTLLPVKPLSLVTAVLLQRVQTASFIQMSTEHLSWARAFSRHYRLADFFLTLAWNQHDYHLSFSLQNRHVTSDDELGYPGSKVPSCSQLPLLLGAALIQQVSSAHLWNTSFDLKSFTILIPCNKIALKTSSCRFTLMCPASREQNNMTTLSGLLLLCLIPHTCDNIQSKSSEYALVVSWWVKQTFFLPGEGPSTDIWLWTVTSSTQGN